MTFKNILKIISAESVPPDLRAAIALSATFHAHLSVVIAGSSAPPPKGSYSTAIAKIWFDRFNRGAHALAESVAAANSVFEESGVEFDLSEEHIDRSPPPKAFCIVQDLR